MNSLCRISITMSIESQCGLGTYTCIVIHYQSIKTYSSRCQVKYKTTIDKYLTNV